MQAYIRALQPIVNAHPRSRKPLRSLLDAINEIRTMDPIAAICQNMNNLNYKDHTFYCRHPLYCGLWINYARVIFHTYGVE